MVVDHESRREGAGMSMMRQSTRIAVVILIVVVAGCGGPDAQGQQDTTAAASAPGTNPGVQAPDTSGGAPREGESNPAGRAPEGEAPGTPGGAPEGEAPGSAGGPGAPGLPGPGSPEEEAGAPESPITIPPFQQIGGQPVDDVRQQIEAAIREACTPRHDLCVTTVVTPRKGADAHACFGGTSPSTHPDSAQLDRGAVLTIYSEPGGCGVPDPSTEPPPSSDTDPTEESQPPPSSDTEPSEASQPPSSS
jgi:hypothetical protein